MSFVARNMFLSIKDLLKRENELASEMSLLKELKRFRHWKIKNKQKKNLCTCIPDNTLQKSECANVNF